MKKLELELSVEEVNLALEALGALPFARVYAVIGSIQEQARRQLAEAEAAGAAGHRGNGGADAAEQDA